MNTALNIRDVGPEIKEALQARAREEGRPMAALARDLLAQSLGVVPETPQDAWRRENANAIAAYNARAGETLARVHAMSAAPIPDFGDDG